MQPNKKVIYEEERRNFKFDYYPDLIMFIIILFALVFINIYGINRIIIEISENPDLAPRSIIFLIIWDIFIPIILWLKSKSLKGRTQFQILEDGFIPYILPKNRRRPKEKHFISVDEIEKLELILIKDQPYWGNYVSVTLKDGTHFYVIEKHVERKGLEELMKFKEMHGL